MVGETKQTYAAKELEAETKQKEGTPQEKFSEEALKESSEHFQQGSLETKVVSSDVKFVEKEKDNFQQREAVIRPQQAGKIDFKSLQNRPKFTSDRTWTSGKGSPQSPSGKSRNRDKGKKAGKGERGNPQQLYRLSITNPRSNPTIGIAYPQQKVSPPKKPEAGRGSVSGSYRFHVPSIPEREAELQQEELSYNRCLQEGSSNLTSPGYTSQAVGSAGEGTTHQHSSSTAQPRQPGPLESSGTPPGNAMVFPDFQLNGGDAWQPPDKTFGGANYGISLQKPNALVEANKANNSFVPLSFQYGYPLLEDSATGPFTCEQNQDYITTSLPPSQVTHSTFPFQPSGERHEAMQTSGLFGSEQAESRPSHSLHSKPQQYLQAPHGVPSSIHCPRGINEDSGSEMGSGSSLHQTEQSKTALPDQSDPLIQGDSRETTFTAGSKRGCPPKTGTANQKALVQGNVHHVRNITQSQGSQMHFSNKVYGSPSLNALQMSPVPLDKSMNKSQSRVTQQWEGPNKAFPSPLDQSPTSYQALSEKNPFQCQPIQNTSSSNQLPWQQMRLTTAIPNQLRQLNNQQLKFLIAPSDWQDDGKSLKCNSLTGSSTFANKVQRESFSNARQDSIKQSCNTVPVYQFNSKVEPSHGQVSDSKNKSVHFGMSQQVPGASSRNCGYTPLQVPPMGLMLVSPYESPSPSPIQNTTSSSTCSSLSPASTSPVNSSLDDSQIKTAPPPFYHQHSSKDHINSNQHHFHSEASRNLPYIQDRAKDDHLNFLPNNRHPKSNGKGCMDGFGLDHHPPPPYSAHQLLATSLAAANLDQLDVLLTCKQCDQNFNNLASFLDHKQYCGQHVHAQNDFKDVPKLEDTRKFQADHSKGTTPGTNYTLVRCPSDLHLSMLGLTKTGELMTDSELKGDAKDDATKLNFFTGNPSSSLPELEMEDAKLDSLITEALNGLGYQSDNAEIDSSFIDAFVDDEPTTTKCISNRQTLKIKDSMMFESRSKHETTLSETSQTLGNYSFDCDLDSLSSESRHVDNIHKEAQQNLKQVEEALVQETTVPQKKSSENSSIQNNWVKDTAKTKHTVEESDSSSRLRLPGKFSERPGLKSSQDNTHPVKPSIPQSSIPDRSSTTQRLIARENKRKRTSGGSWSKELIHKIVQQKNKFHKLHVKGTKNLQFSLVMERLTPSVQNPTFREYDYVSDSDEECEPVKIASQGRLSQSMRCKYTYTKECKSRVRGERSKGSPWRQEKDDCFGTKKTAAVSQPPVKEVSCHQRLRRRSSRSSTSSDLSTSLSVSSESSPKSTDRTDSDSEKRVGVRRTDSDSFEQSEQEISPQRVCKESTRALSLSFLKSTKKYNCDKTLSEHKYGYTVSKCSNVSIETSETTTEHKNTHKNSISLSRSKSTRAPQEENENHGSCERSHTGNTDETKAIRKDGQVTNTTRKGFESSFYPAEATSRKGSSRSSKVNKEDPLSMVKLVPKKNDDSSYSASHQDSDSSSSVFDKLSDNVQQGTEKKSTARDLLTQSPSLCSTLMDEVCLSPSNLHDSITQKERQCILSYPIEQDQSLMKSPLSFDTSAMFGDLTVGGFDNNLYSEIQLNKEALSPLESTSDKRELFESSFSPFLEQRDWGLMVDVTPVLPDEISEYKDDPDLTNAKKTNFNQVPLTLPEKIMEYNSNMNSCVSEDELEIKRIVTELESQLQTTKLSSSPLLDNELPKPLAMSKFSPLRLDHESNNEQSGLSVECSSENLGITASSLPSDTHAELFPEPDLPWSSPVQFGLMGGQQCLHTPTHSETSSHNYLGVKGDSESTMVTLEKQPTLHMEDKTEVDVSIKSPATDKSEEMLENELYTENLMKSLEVISDSIFKKCSSTSVLEESNHSQTSSELSENVHKTDKDIKKQTHSNVASTDPLVRAGSTNSEVEVSCLKSKDHSNTNETLSRKPNKSSTVRCEKSETDPSLTTGKSENHSEAVPFDKHLQMDDHHFTEKTCGSVSTNNLNNELNPETSQELLIPTDIEKTKQLSDCETSACQVDEGMAKLDSKLESDPDSTEIHKDCEFQILPHVASSTDKQEVAFMTEDSSQGGLTLKECDNSEQHEKQQTHAPLKEASAELDATVIPCQSQSTLKKEPSNDETFSALSEHGDFPEMDKVKVISPEQLAVSKSDPEFPHAIDPSTSNARVSPISQTCGENIKETDEQTPILEPVPPITPFLPSPLHANWHDIDKLSPAVQQEVHPVRELSSDDVSIGKSLETCVSSLTSGLGQSFGADLSLEITESKISSPGTLLAVNSISNNSTFRDLSEPSVALSTPSDKDSDYGFKLNPQNYHELSDGARVDDCFNSVTSNEGIVEQTNVKLSPNHCSIALDISATSTVHPALQETETKRTEQAVNLGGSAMSLQHVHSDNPENLSDIQDSMNTSQVRLETIDYMDLQSNFIKKADVDNLDSQQLPLKAVPKGQEETLMAEPVCTADLPILSINQTNVTIPDEEKSTKQLETSEALKKGGVQHAAQGKFQCEICSMYFRTMPGLKRHKAMKHLVKANGTLKVRKSHVDPIVLLSTEQDSISMRQGVQGDVHLMFEGKASDASLSTTTESKDKDMNVPQSEKVKKTVKGRKTTSTDVNSDCLTSKVVKSDPFPDELLSILKTDILQAISPDFPSMVQQGYPNSPDKQDAIYSRSGDRLQCSEDIQDILTTNNDHQEATPSLSQQPILYSHVLSVDGRNASQGLKSPHHSDTLDSNAEADASCKDYEVAKVCLDMEKNGKSQIVMDQDRADAELLGNTAVEVKCENSIYSSDIADPVTSCFKDPQLSPTGLGSDLKTLLDDESTFSQLFPRNEEMKRKKCARVYGKSNKKQKLAPVLPLKPDFSTADLFVDKREDYKENKMDQILINHCEYETVSIEDALMLDMCHKTTLNSSVEEICLMKDSDNLGNSCEGTSEIGIRDFLSPTEDSFGKSSAPLDGSNVMAAKSPMSSEAQTESEIDASSAPCSVTPGASYIGSTLLQENTTNFPTIDIQNLKATFQLPEIQFFEPEKDISLSGPIVTREPEMKDSARSCKKPPERKGKKRIEAGLKPKDKQYKCKVCFRWFLTLGGLDFHKLSHNPSPPPTCYMCVQRKFSSREQLRDHLREKHAKNKAGAWTCGMCLKEISDVWMYNEHLREHATQFARKGQSQSSLLDMPGCFMQENAVKNFITSIMQHRPSKSIKGETVKSSSKEENRVSVDGTAQELKSVEGDEPLTVKSKPTSGGGSKHGTFTPLEVLHNAETAPKSVEMHPNCKDPSRDCHHCGKQFPKPFKLQRHLVVHSLQKIFLCHKCPVSYQEAKELKDHLKSEHEEVDEPDSKHTTLYTCELCADVMHVIKKSFICSTCNYTFSKKEQFDRHMEKHLAGGNKIFKFRGVLRPCKPSNSKEDEFDMPSSKRRKIQTESLQENSSDSGIASLASLPFSQGTDTQNLKPIIADNQHSCSDEPSCDANNASVKIEDEAEDFSEILEELEQCQLQIDSADQTYQATALPKAESGFGSPQHEPSDRVTRDVGTDKASPDICEVKIEEERLCDVTQIIEPGLSHEGRDSTEVKTKQCALETSIQATFENSNEQVEMGNSNATNMQVNYQMSKSMTDSDSQGALPGSDHDLIFGRQSSPKAINQEGQEVLREHSTSNENEEDPQSPSHTEETSSGQNKDKHKTLPKPEENNEKSPVNSPRPGTPGTVETAPDQPMNIIPFNSPTREDKDSIKQLKRRKDPKTPHSSQRMATRENLGIDTRVRKKFRPSKCESIAGQRKSDGPSDYPVLLSVKDDVVSNKIVKQKASPGGLQPKKSSQDNCPQRKAEIVRHLNGNYKVKKGLPVKHVRSPTSNVSISPMNNPCNKSRPKALVRSMETHAYRTAESQSNLLSQLFGQRLTSFKIPLKKDTSESMN